MNHIASTQYEGLFIVNDDRNILFTNDMGSSISSIFKNELIELFNNESSLDSYSSPIGTTRDEYDIILNNIIHTFINTSFLKSQIELKEKKQKTAEMTALQLQINPHFLFDILQTLDLKALELSVQPSAMNSIISYLSDILKYSLEDSTSRITLRSEINYLNKYDHIQHYRYEEKYILYYEIDEDVLDASFFRLMLQPLVENSLYHGIKPLEGNGYIKIKIFKRNHYLYISVIDSGIGMTKEETKNLYMKIIDKKSQNIGLTNVNRRLQLHFGEESHLHIMSKVGMGTCISFQIPC